METEEEKEKGTGEPGEGHGEATQPAEVKAEEPATTEAVAADASKSLEMVDLKTTIEKIEEYKYERKYQPMDKNVDGTGLASHMTAE